MEWQTIDSAPSMICVLLYGEWFSHGRTRHGYSDMNGDWCAVNANGTDDYLKFAPTHWMPLPAPPKE